MRILLVNPTGGYVHEYPPLGLLYIAAVLKENGNTVAFFDEGARRISEPHDLVDFAEEFKPDMCGFSLYTTNVLGAYDAIGRIKAICSECMIVVGGHHATALPERTMTECQQIDFLCFGEGEQTMLELVNAVEEGVPPANIYGLYYRDDGQVLSTPPRPFIKDLNTLPFPSWEFIQDFEYVMDPVRIGKNIATIVTSRGCPFNCVFCNKAVFGSSYRRRSPANVVAEIKHLREKYGVDEVYFMDDLFATQKKWLDEFCRELRDNGAILPWKCLGRVDTLTKTDLQAMKNSGCYVIQYGVESGNDKILLDIKKRITTKQAIRAFKETKKAGINTYAFFMLGHRLDTPDTIKQTLQFAQNLNPDFISFFALVPFPGTQVYEFLPEETKHDWNRIHYSHWHPDVLPISISSVKPEDISTFEKQVYMEYYGRIGYLVNCLRLGPTSILNKIKWENWKVNMVKKIKMTMRGERIFKKNRFESRSEFSG